MGIIIVPICKVVMGIKWINALIPPRSAPRIQLSSTWSKYKVSMINRRLLLFKCLFSPCLFLSFSLSLHVSISMPMPMCMSVSISIYVYLVKSLCTFMFYWLWKIFCSKMRKEQWLRKKKVDIRTKIGKFLCPSECTHLLFIKNIYWMSTYQNRDPSYNKKTPK